MEKGRLPGIVWSIIILAIMLTGCGRDHEETEPVSWSASISETVLETEMPSEEESETELQTEETESEETAAAESTAADDELVYWSIWEAGSEQAAAIQEALNHYMEATGVKVHVEWKGQEISRLLQPALESGTHIDLFDEEFERVAGLYARDCMDLEEMAAQAGYETYARPIFTQQMRNQAGSLKGIAYQPYLSGVFYNKKMFQKAGIEKEPENWMEFLDVCRALKDAGYAPLALDDAYVMMNFGFQLARYMGEGAAVSLCADGGWTTNNKAMRVIRNMEKLVTEEYLEKDVPGEYPESQNTVGKEETAMIVGPSWIPAEIEQASGRSISWGFFPYPAVSGGTDPSTVTNIGAMAFAIPSGAHKPDEAFSLIMMLTSAEWDQRISLETQVIPADSRNVVWPRTVAECQEAFDSVTGIYSWNMGLETNKELAPVLQNSLIRLFDGQITASEFAEEIEDACQ